MMDFSGETERALIRHILNSDMGLCGCGSDDRYEVVRRLLEMAQNQNDFEVAQCIRSLGMLNQRNVEFLSDVMFSWKLFQHGNTLRFPSLTDKGKALLEFFETFGTDDDQWPTWTGRARC